MDRTLAEVEALLVDFPSEQGVRGLVPPWTPGCMLMVYISRLSSKLYVWPRTSRMPR